MAHLQTWETYWMHGGSGGAANGFDAYGRINVYLDSQSIENNTSSIYIDHYVYAQVKGTNLGVILNMSSKYRANNGSFGGTYKSVTKEITVDAEVGEKSYYLGRTWHTITHNTDGTAKLYVNGNISGDGDSTTSSFKEKTLPTIPRMSVLTATRANIGEVSQLTITKRNENYVHSIKYQFGTLSGYILSDGTTTNTESKLTEKNIGFTIPTSFYEQMPNTKEDVCTLTLTTYNENTKIGTEQTTTFYVDVANDKTNQPNLSANILDINEITRALTNADNTLIKGYSIASISYEASGKKFAIIQSVTMNNIRIDENPVVISHFGENNVELIATDSRGFITAKQLEYTLIDYFEPTISIKAKRTFPTENEIKVSFSGNIFNQSFGMVMNQLFLSWVYRIKGEADWIIGGTLVQDVDFVINNNTYHSGLNNYESEISLGKLFNYENNYEIGIMYGDKLFESIISSTTVSKGKPILNWNDKEVNVNGDIKKDGVSIFEMLYPVGSVYISTKDVSPKNFFGGEWKRIKDTFLLGAGDIYEAGSNGGEATHTLTVEELPLHGHPQNYAGGSSGSINRAVTTNTTGGSMLGDAIHGKSHGSKMASQYSYVQPESPALIIGTGRVGGGKTHNNLPPYLSVYIWERIR